jgi:uncharacterized protein (TIGR00106 family)
MLAAFSIYPMETEHLSRDVAKVIDILQATGLAYRLGPMGACVEGSWERVLAAVQRCHRAVAEDHERVITTIVIDDRKTWPHDLREMAAQVEGAIGRRVPRSDMDRQC